MTLIPFDRHAQSGLARQQRQTDGHDVSEPATVLPFAAPSDPSPDEPSFDAAGLLAACRDQLAHGVATAFAEDLARAADNLLAQADRAPSSEAQGLYFAAHGILAKQGRQLLQQFRQDFVASCTAALLAQDQPASKADLPPFGELSLVADDQFERELAIGRLTSRAVYACSQQLTALDRRIAALRRGRRISQEDNPLYPKAIFSAFLDACEDLGACDRAELVLLQEFGHRIIGGLPQIYQETNRFLMEHDVLPDIPLGAAPPRDPSASGTAQMPPAGPSPGRISLRPAAPASPAAAAGDALPEDVFDQIAERLLSVRPRGYAPAAPGVPGVPQLAPAAAPSGAQLLEALTELQRGAQDVQQFPGLDPQHADPAAGDLLRQIRSNPLIAQSHPLDAITVDVVSMLFDLLLNDRELPDAVRAEIGRLQIPILKVAMLDKGFFSSRQHPARRLLDAIAGAATGWREEDLPRLIAKVRSICDTVLHGFDRDTSIFSAQIGVLARFLAAEKDRDKETVARRRDELEHADRKARVREEVARQIQRHTDRADLPDLLRDFLERFWRVALVKAWLHPGEGEAAWREAVTAMDDLVWSVAPKASAEERQRLFELLPTLLARLRAGLASVELEGEWDGFFKGLIRMHVQAVQPSPNRGEPPGPAPAVPTERLAPTEVQAADGAVVEPEPPPPAPPSDRDGHYRELALGLAEGTWIEFRSDRGTKRSMCLNWASQQRGAYLFSNLQGDDTMIVATTRLAERLRDGSARILSGRSPTERAVSRLLTTVTGGTAPAG